MTLEDISEREILERVDEYSLFCFYLEFEPTIGKQYRSKIRPGDERPSFGIYKRKFGGDLPNEFMWKDQGMPVGKYMNYGDVFDLVMVLFQYETRLEALMKVASDHDLMSGKDTGVKRLLDIPQRSKEKAEIRILSKDFDARDLAYWSKYNITPEILKRYNVTSVDTYYMYASDLFPTKAVFPMYAYRIYHMYQLYQPKPKAFFMNWDERCIPGAQQLDRTDLLIITKAYKDVMFLKSLGFDSICPKAENNIPTRDLIESAKNRYNRVVTLFDNDDKSSPHLYPFESLFIPKETGIKDPTDFCAVFGPQETFQLLNTLLCLQ